MNTKNIKKHIIGFCLVFSLFISISSTFAVQDIMEVMFQPAKSFEKIVDLGNTKDAVGNEVFRESEQYGIQVNMDAFCTANGQEISATEIESQKTSNGYNGSNKDYCEKILGGDYEKTDITGTDQKQAPLIVRITKFLLRMTIVLAITMVLYNGVMWVVESAKGGEVKDAKDNLVLILGGVLLALSSVGLINLVSSITISSLNIAEGPGCKINGTMIPKGDSLKKEVCENSFDGKWYGDRIGNRCKINDDWKAITDTEQVSKCSELGGVYIDN